MVQLDSGGGDADGGLEGPDSQTEIDDDTGDAQERRLRPDAQSDPMEDQTEPVDRGSASQTTARPASGSAGAASGAAGGGRGGEQTAPGPDDGPQVSSGAPSGPDGQQDGLTPGETAVATGGADDPRVTTGTPGDRGVAPRRDRTLPADTGGQADPIVVGPDEDPQQVVEREVEQQIEQQTGRDVTPGEEFEVVRENGQFRVELSGPFLASLSREGARAAGRDMTESTDAQFGSGEGPALESGGIEVSTDYFNLQPGEAVPHRGSIDVEAVEEFGERKQSLAEAVEEDIEGQVGATRAERAGITNPTLRQNVVENVDLERGQDFTLSFQQGPGTGRLTVSTGLTESFSQEEAERAFERDLFNQLGARLEPGEDFRAVENEEGGFDVEFTERGRGRVQLATLDRTVRNVERGQIPVLTSLTGIRGPRFNVPGEGAAVPEATDTSSLTVEEDTFTLADLGEEFTERVQTGIEAEQEAGPMPGSVTPGIESGPLRTGVAGGLSDFSAMIGGAIGLPTRGSRFLAAGAESRREGQFDEFTATASATATRMPAEFASGQTARFRDEPVTATGGLVGTLVGSALVMRAAPRTRFAIQPGEEIAGIGGFRATRAIAGERTAQRLFPDQEPLIFSEEAAIRGARGLGARATRTAGRVESGVGRATGRVSAGAAETVRRAPSVRFESDTEAGLIDIDPQVRAQVRAAASRPGQAVRSGAETVRQAPRRAAAGAVETGRDVLDTGRQSIERGRQTLTRLELEAEDFGFRAGQRTAAGVERVEQFPSELADIDPSELARGARRRGASAIETGRQQLTLAELQAEEFGFRAGQATAERVNRPAEFDPRDLGSGRLTGAVETGRQRLTLAELRAEDFGFRAGQRTAAGVERIEHFPVSVAELPARGARGAVEAVETGRQRLTRLELEAEERAFRAGQATGERVTQVESLLGDVADAPGRVRAAPREAIAGFEVGRGAAGLGDIPGFEAFPGQIQTGRAFEFGFEAGETTSELGDRASDLFSGTRDRITGAGETLTSLPDMTLRVEPGVPGRPVVPDVIFESATREAGDMEPFAGPFDTAGETDVEDAPLDPTRTGRGTDPLLLAVESELESPMETEGELAAEATRPRLESLLGSDLVSEVGAPSDLMQETRLEPGSELAQDVVGREVELGRQEFIQETETELEFEQRFDFPFEFETELELEAEAEQEAELEAEFEAETEAELEAIPFGVEPRRRDRDDATGSFYGRDRLVERELLNPITGE